MTVINESGLYALILSSKLPQAKAFKRWVTNVVLPQIRKTGGYIPTTDAQGRQLTSEEIIDRADAIVGRTIRMLNEEAEETLTATQVAKTFNMTTSDFNAVLCSFFVKNTLQMKYEAVFLIQFCHVIPHTFQLYGGSHQIELVKAGNISIECFFSAWLEWLMT